MPHSLPTWVILSFLCFPFSSAGMPVWPEPDGGVARMRFGPISGPNSQKIHIRGSGAIWPRTPVYGRAAAQSQPPEKDTRTHANLCFNLVRDPPGLRCRARDRLWAGERVGGGTGARDGVSVAPENRPLNRRPTPRRTWSPTLGEGETWACFDPFSGGFRHFGPCSPV